LKIQVLNIAKTFGREQVLVDVSLTVVSGQTMSILGSSGCGKTTLLRIIAGHESADSGKIMIGETDIISVSPEKRGIVYLSQDALLFPHLNVESNIEFGMRVAGLDSETRLDRVEQLLEQIGMRDHGKKKPEEISGGQRQRVAFARAIAVEPSVVLLDEPFGSLDVQTRREMQDLYIDLSSEARLTALFVTHDLREAIRVGDRFATLDNGHMDVANSLESFVADERHGIVDEVRFWTGLPHPGRN